MVLDRKVSFAARVSIRVMHELFRGHESVFPQRVVPIYEAGRRKTAICAVANGAGAYSIMRLNVGTYVKGLPSLADLSGLACLLLGE